MDDLPLQCLGSCHFPTRLPRFPKPECQEASVTRDCFMMWCQSKGREHHHEEDFTQAKQRCAETPTSVERILIMSQDWTNPEIQGLFYLDIPRWPVPTLDLASMQTSSTGPFFFSDLLRPSMMWTECLYPPKFIHWNTNPGWDGIRR